MLRLLRGNNLLKNRVQIPSDSPIGIMRLEFTQVRDVADVIALARFVDILPIQLLPGYFSDFRDCFKHGNAVRTSATPTA